MIIIDSIEVDGAVIVSNEYPGYSNMVSTLCAKKKSIKIEEIHMNYFVTVLIRAELECIVVFQSRVDVCD